MVFRDANCYDCRQITSGDCGQHNPPLRIERPTLWLGDLYKEGYRAGQLAMRERAAKKAMEPLAPTTYAETYSTAISAAIRALEPEEPK